MMLSLLFAALVSVGLSQAQAPAAPPAAVTREEAVLVSEAYAALATGDLGTAVARASLVRQRFPRGSNALLLGLEVDIAQLGGLAALDGYEQWLGSSRPEQPLALRRIATAVLTAAGASVDAGLRLAALSALAEDGEAWASDRIRAASTAGSIAEASILAAAGDAPSVKRVADALSTPVPNKIAMVRALARSRSPAAVPALVRMLDDPRPEHQAAAAEALGQLGAREQITRLQAILKRPNAPQYLTIAAAQALMRLDDFSGYAQLQTWMTSEVPGMRVAAAQALSDKPDQAWIATVRELTREADPMIRLEAATLIAPVDPDVARAVFEQLSSHADPSIRTMASQTATTAMPADLRELRGLLRSAEAVRVAAARRILEATR